MKVMYLKMRMKKTVIPLEAKFVPHSSDRWNYKSLLLHKNEFLKVEQSYIQIVNILYKTRPFAIPMQMVSNKGFATKWFHVRRLPMMVAKGEMLPWIRTDIYFQINIICTWIYKHNDVHIWIILYNKYISNSKRLVNTCKILCTQCKNSIHLLVQGVKAEMV